MNLTLKIKLLPNADQAHALTATIRAANASCNRISEVAWETQTFPQFRLHKETYYPVRETSGLSSQMVVRCISKVADAYKKDRNRRREFRPLGCVAYDSRILTYQSDSVSIWVLGGRLQIPFVCHHTDHLPYIKGEADLMYRKGKFFLLQTVVVPDEPPISVDSFVGVDLGLVSLATTSTGIAFCSKDLTRYREQRQKVRSSVQRKGTKSSKRLLKRFRRREQTTAAVVNHTISKRIVAHAEAEGKGIALEELRGIRFSANKKGKAFRSRIGKWNFNQMRQYIHYKATRVGIPVVLVEPRYTSKTCHECRHIGNRRGKSFACDNCGNNMDADINAAINIATLGAAVNQPEGYAMWSCALHVRSKAAIPLG